MMPAEREVDGLLALMLLHDARRAARIDARGELVLLADQDRSLWDREQIAEGLERSRRAAPRRGGAAPGPYALQAAIAAEHCARRDRGRHRLARGSARLYDWLALVQPSPVVELNRAVAIAMAEGPQRGLDAIDAIEGLDAYVHLHSARADLLRRAGRAARRRASTSARWSWPRTRSSARSSSAAGRARRRSDAAQ